MDFKTIDHFNFKDKTALVRVDLNCPIDPKTGNFIDTRRIKVHASTIRELADKGAKVVVMAHQGRPEGEYDFTTLEKHARELEKTVGRKVSYVADIMGPTAQHAIKSMKSGEILLLENVRFLSEENLKRSADLQAKTHFVKTLSKLADYYVGDAFAAAHRSQPSIVGFCEVLPSCAGRVMQEEIEVMDKILISNRKPGIYLAGGAKIKSSLRVARQFLSTNVMDKVLTGGLVAAVFLTAKGHTLHGTESIDDFQNHVNMAKEILDQFPDKIEVPSDLAFDKEGKRFEAPVSTLPQPYMFSDIGSETIKKYVKILKEAGTIVANGPVGIFETPEFAKGTAETIKAIAESKAFKVVGGGHIASAVVNQKLEDKITHISTGGGACITYLAGIKLYAIDALEKAAARDRQDRGAD